MTRLHWCSPRQYVFANVSFCLQHLPSYSNNLISVKKTYFLSSRNSYLCDPNCLQSTYFKNSTNCNCHIIPSPSLHYNYREKLNLFSDVWWKNKHLNSGTNCYLYIRLQFYELLVCIILRKLFFLVNSNYYLLNDCGYSACFISFL